MYTQIFNNARVLRGLAPVDVEIDIIREGVRMSCGCAVLRASPTHFTVDHDPATCTSRANPPLGRRLVGDPNAPTGSETLACGRLLSGAYGLTNPYLGIWPYGV